MRQNIPMRHAVAKSDGQTMHRLVTTENKISALRASGIGKAKRSIQEVSRFWFEHFGQSRVSSPSWPLDQAILARTVVYWPTEYQWRPSSSFIEPIRLGMAHWVNSRRRAIPQPYKGICVFELELDDRCHSIAIDYSDYVDRIDWDCFNRVALYFKMQCRREGYGIPQQQRYKLIPGGYVTGDCRTTPDLPHLRETAKNNTSQFKVYGRFGPDFAREIRRSAVERLRRDSTLNYTGGIGKVSYRQSLREASRSRICIDLPGQGDFCFRLLDYLAVGAFVIAYPHKTTLPEPLIDRHHIVYMQPDMSDLVSLCHYYLEHQEERLFIRNNAADYFDRHASYIQLGSWYTHQCLKDGAKRLAAEPISELSAA